MPEGNNEIDIRLHLELSRVYLKAEHYLDALKEIDAALSLAPHFADLNFEAGVVHGQLGHHEQAIQYYERALDANPTYIEARINLANALFEQHRVEEATHHQKLVHYVQEHKGLLYGIYGPRLANAHAVVGDLYVEMGMFREAADEYARAVRIAPRFHDIVLKLAQAYIEVGELDAARSALESIIQKEERHRTDAARLLGTILMKLGKREEALAVWKGVLSEAPEDAETLALVQRAQH